MMPDDGNVDGKDDEQDPVLVGRIKEKLIKSKKKWAENGRLLTGAPDRQRENRLPPGQRQVTDWPVLDLGVQPQLDRQDWKLRIYGEVEHEVIWDWQQFMDQPQVKDTSDIHCVTAWSRFDNSWDGVSAQHIISLVKPKKSANHVIFHSYDGYTTNVSLEVFAGNDVLLAHSWEGKPLSREHGAPVRVIVPQYYFWKSAKWVRRIEFVDADQPGFWETRGYHNVGDPWEEERYS